MLFLDKLFSHKTYFKAGGLILRDIPASAVLMKEPDKFVAPKKLDFRDMCIETSNQGPLPYCTGYATAGYIEVQNWRTLHYPEQVDGDRIYAEAKKLDGYSGDGTFLWCAVQGAMNLDLINGTIEYIIKDRQKLRFAIHQYCVCIACFNITDEWNSVGRDGRIPNWNNSRAIGGHAVLIVGYNDEGIYIQNSWSACWGLYGFAFLTWEQFDRQFENGAVIRK